MKMTVLALATAMMLAGTAASTVSAHDSSQHDERSSQYDRSDRYDDRYDNRDDNRYGDRYDDRRDDRYDGRYDDRRVYTYNQAPPRWNDRDCDGVPNRRDSRDNRNARDRDCDGIRNRHDRHDDRARVGARYHGPRYVQPRGYSYSRWDIGTRLPSGYYGNSYYVDYRPYNLAPPRSGYRWNRVGNDVYMVSMRDGMIANVIYNLFR